MLTQVITSITTKVVNQAIKLITITIVILKGRYQQAYINKKNIDVRLYLARITSKANC